MWPHSPALAGVGWGLQENGYLVLRFLAEDVAKDLDSVLDGILRSLSHRQTTALMSDTISGLHRGPPGVDRGLMVGDKKDHR